MAELETYYKLSILLMSFMGLWPYQNTKLRRLQSGIITLSSGYFVTAQFMVFKTAEFTLSLLLKNLSPIIMYLGSVVKYNAFWYQIDTIKEFMERVKCDWNTKHEAILKILENRASAGRYHAKLYTFFVYPSALIVTILHLASFVVITDVPLNGTRRNYFPIMTEYLIDEEKYLYLIVFHQNFSLFLCASIFVATETLFIMWLQHAASLYEITSYHIKVAVSEGTVSSISQDLADYNSKRCLMNAVLAHKKAAKFAKDLKEKFQISYSFLLVFGVISLSVNFFLLSEAVCLTHDLEELMMSLLFSITELVYMFYINFLIQQLLDHADSIIIITYNTNWYKTSVPIQKMLLMIMLRCSEPLDFTLFGFYCASIEGFSTLVKNCMSYFMMMSSLEY